MLGPEVARAAVRDHLALHVPAALAKIRTAAGDTNPADPTGYLLADSVAEADINKPGRFPVILVRAPGLDERDPFITDGGRNWTFRYDMEIAILVDTSKFADHAGSSVGRDRLMLAVREVLWTQRTVSPAAEIAMRPYKEKTGEVAHETRQGRPLSAGEIYFQLDQEEPFDPLPLVTDAEASIEAFT